MNIAISGYRSTLPLIAIMLTFFCLSDAEASFKIRFGENGTESADLYMGNPSAAASTLVVKVKRYQGVDSLPVATSWELLEGDPAHWDIQLPGGPSMLGPAPSVSRADQDRDGDVDADDEAALDACFTGAGVILADDRVAACVNFDHDGDLDIDDQDRAALQSDFTGPYPFPPVLEVDLSAQATALAPDGAVARLRITAQSSSSGESSSAYVYLIKKKSKFDFGPITRTDFTQHRLDKLTFGRQAFYGLELTNQSSEDDLIELSVDPVDGFSFFWFNGQGRPQVNYPLAPKGSDPESYPPAGWKTQLFVASPPGWPRLSEQTFTATARSLLTGESKSVELHLTKAAAMWTPSDLFGPRGRRHNVRAGHQTSFLLTIHNIFDFEQEFNLLALKRAPSPLWTAQLSETNFTLLPGEQTEVKVTLTAPPGAQVGDQADYNIILSEAAPSGPAWFFNVARVGAEVTDSHKIIYVAVDGLQPDYMYLNAEGTGPGQDGDWLMPNIQSLISQSTNYTNARVHLPSVTDAQHANALTGSLTATSGSASVFYYYYGVDQDDRSIAQQGDQTVMLHGQNGDPVLSIFDVAKLANPNNHTALALGKNWIAEYFRQDPGGFDVLLMGREKPHYIADPLPYVLGDPPTDEDAETDPRLKADFSNWGQAAGMFPEDRWILENSIRIIENEDPDFMYILLAHVDDAQHQMGAAWDPSEWDDQGTATLWDDVNLVNPQATRHEVLDVVHELDDVVGELVDFLIQRGTFDDTYLVLLADHGFVTQSPYTIDIRKVLEPGGFTVKEDYDAYGGGGVLYLWDVDPARETEFETLLEQAQSITPGEVTNPWVVMNRAEMETGIDVFSGRSMAIPRELYSEYFAEFRQSDEQIWPSFFMFLDGKWQSEYLFLQAGEDAEWGRLFVGSHGGPETQHIPIISHGPGFTPGQVVTDVVSVSDITPTIYHLLGWPVPSNVDGNILPDVVSP